MNTALITGAAGFIGSHLVEGLLERGYRVRGVDDLSTGDRDRLDAVWEDESFSFVEGDVRNAETVATAVQDVDVIFHLAAYISVAGSVEHPALASDVNCVGTARVLEAARSADVEGAVLASSTAVYGPDPPVPTNEAAAVTPDSPYALSKAYGEELAGQLTVPAVAVRYFNVYGPRQDPSGEYAAVIPAFIERMLAGKRPIIYGDGEQTRDFVFVEDVVSATIQAGEAVLEAEGLENDEVSTGSCPAFNVATGNRLSINELVEVLNALFGTDLEPIHEPPRPGDVKHSGADISRAREVLGYEPRFDFGAGLERTIEFYRDG